LNTTDTRSDALRDCFDFAQTPRPFTPIAALHRAAFFTRPDANEESPDND